MAKKRVVPKPESESESNVRFFRLIGRGGHQEGSGEDAVNYVQGDVIETENDLCKLFSNKFEEVT